MDLYNPISRVDVNPNPRIMIFIDGANIYHSCITYSGKIKRNWNIDFQLLINSISIGRDLIRVYYFCAIPKSPPAKQVQFYYNLQSKGIVLVKRPLKYSTKGISYEKGVDVALVTKLLKMAHEKAFDIGVIVSGDCDYAEAVKAVMDYGLRIEVYSFKDSLATELRECCDKFIFLDSLADKIEFKNK